MFYHSLFLSLLPWVPQSSSTLQKHVLHMSLYMIMFGFVYMFIFYIFFNYCFAGWGYIVALTKSLTIYQIYHTWVYPFHHSPFTPFLEWFNRYHFSIIQIQEHYEKQVTLRGGHIWQKEGKRRKLRRWIWLMYSLYKTEYRIFKPVEI
jgi:hypothetical protein